MSRYFSPGLLYVTPGISQLIQSGADITPLLARHLHGDWGDVDDEDKAANDRAVLNGGMILSAYKSDSPETVWILTQDGTTTVMLPEEY